MKICNYCKTPNFDSSELCSRCQQPLNTKPTVKKESELSTAAKVLMIISTVAAGIGFLAYFVLWIATLILYKENPSDESMILLIAYFIYMATFFILACIDLAMTSSFVTKLSKKRTISMAFKICTLLFVNLVAGILLLCDKENGYREIAVQPIPAPMQPNNSVDELKKYKELLDSDIITQEEFEEKKKQLLQL